jgi:hypothetical protein
MWTWSYEIGDAGHDVGRLRPQAQQHVAIGEGSADLTPRARGSPHCIAAIQERESVV